MKTDVAFIFIIICVSQVCIAYVCEFVYFDLITAVCNRKYLFHIIPYKLRLRSHHYVNLNTLNAMLQALENRQGNKLQENLKSDGRVCFHLDEDEANNKNQ